MNGEGLVERGVIVGDHHVVLKAQQLIGSNRKHPFATRHGFDEIDLCGHLIGNQRIEHIGDGPFGILGEHVIARAWGEDQSGVAPLCILVFNFGDQATLVLCFDVDNLVANKMFSSIDGERPKDHKERKQRQGDPLVFGFLLKETPPSASHEVGWERRMMKTLLQGGGSWR